MSEKKILVRIERDIWVPNAERGECDRIRKGTVTEVELTDEILDGIEAGKISRVKDAEKAPAKGK